MIQITGDWYTFTPIDVGEYVVRKHVTPPRVYVVSLTGKRFDRGCTCIAGLNNRLCRHMKQEREIAGRNRFSFAEGVAV